MKEGNKGLLGVEDYQMSGGEDESFDFSADDDQRNKDKTGQSDRDENGAKKKRKIPIPAGFT